MIELIKTDCVKYMKTLPDKAFDLAICDPPYGIRESAHRANLRTKKAKTRCYGSQVWDMKIPSRTYFRELFRVSKHQIIWGGNYFLDHLGATRCMIVWRKLPSGNFADCELAWTSFKTSVREFTYMWNGMNQGRSINEGHLMQGDKSLNEVRIHPCQKPVALYKWLLHNYAQPGWKILDTHLGSGSIAVACHDMGFDLVGCEIIKQYHRDASKRLSAVQKQAVMAFIG
jgi:site-specific DNA-methyltransferase (adenine-specific)